MPHPLDDHGTHYFGDGCPTPHGHVEHPDDAVHAFDRGATTPVEAVTDGGPHTWASPGEPGPEVSAVRDRGGYLHKRGTHFSHPWMDERGVGRSWSGLLVHRGPLTDATAEVAAETQADAP